MQKTVFTGNLNNIGVLFSTWKLLVGICKFLFMYAMVFDLSILINKPEEINGLKFQHVFHSLLLINIIGCFSNPDAVHVLNIAFFRH